MLTKTETDALHRWYATDAVVDKARSLLDRQQYLELEEFIHMTSLVPLHRHTELPDYMLDDEGKPLFPSNLNPRNDQEKWQDAVEIGWKVVEEKLGLTHDDLHRRVASEQDDDWDRFMKSVEARKNARAKGSE